MFKDAKHFAELCLKLGYQFRNKKLLAQAITTESAYKQKLQKSNIGHQETLEFVGDGILKQVVNVMLANEFPYYNSGQLSKLRDEIIKNVNLSQAAKKMNLSSYVFMDAKQEAHCQQSASPKILADTIEAIIGAIYKDSNGNVKEVERFILNNSAISTALKQHRVDEQKRHESLFDAIRQLDLAAIKKMSQEQKLNFNSVVVRQREEAKWDARYGDEIHVVSEQISPLSFAIANLRELVCNKKDTKIIIAIIAELIKQGADVNLQLKGEFPLIYQLLIPINAEGKYADPFFFEFTANLDEKVPSIFRDHTKKLSQKDKGASVWSKTTDEVVKLFCENGVDLSIISSSHTALESTIVFDETIKFDTLLKYADPNQLSTVGRKNSALHTAAAAGKKEFVDKLLQAKAHPGYHNRDGETPFDVAKTLELKKLLLKAELTVQLTDAKSGAVDSKQLNEQAVALYKEGLDQKLLPSLDKAIDLFKQILQKNLKILPSTDTALISNYYNLGSAYFQRKNFQQAKIMLDRAYTLSVMVRGEDKPETTKIKKRLDECIQLLKDKDKQEMDNPSLASNNRYGMFPSAAAPKQNDSILDKRLFLAMKLSARSQVEVLLKEGADPNAVDDSSDEKLPALHYAIIRYAGTKLSAEAVADIKHNVSSELAHRSLEIVKLLLTWCADVNKTDGKGRAALHIAARTNRSEVIYPLLAVPGINLELPDYEGNFPSHLATEDWVRRIMLEALQVPSNSAAAPSQVKLI